MEPDDIPEPAHGWYEQDRRARAARGLKSDAEVAAEVDAIKWQLESLEWRPRTRNQHDAEMVKAAREARKRADDNAREHAARRWVFINDGFSKHHTALVLADELAETPAMKFARSFAAGPKRMIVFGGSVGAGKTTGATWLAWHHGGSHAGAITATQLAKAGMYDDKVNNFVQSRTLLVVNDLGAEFLDGKGMFRSVFDGLVDEYYERGARLVITTNLGKEDLAERYGARVVSRLAEVGTFVRCGDEDLRRTMPAPALVIPEPKPDEFVDPWDLDSTPDVDMRWMQPLLDEERQDNPDPPGRYPTGVDEDF